MNSILIIEDDESIRHLLFDFFSDHGFAAETAADGEEALEKLETLNPSVILLDVMLPKVDGWTVAKSIRKSSMVPIIMATAKNEEHDELYGFSLGINDYVRKPFSLEILLARVNAQIPPESSVFRSGSLFVDYGSNVVKVDGMPVSLSKTEFHILHILASNPNMTLSRDFIIQKVWGYGYFGDSRTVDTHVTRLRNKLGPSVTCIQTVRGFGYRLVMDK